MLFARSLDARAEGVRFQFGLSRSAADELQQSPCFRNLLAAAWSLGNYINHGSTESSEGAPTQGFTLEGPTKLREFKSAKGHTALHFLCQHLMKKEFADEKSGKRKAADFCALLQADLESIPGAARVVASEAKAELSLLEEDIHFAEQELRGGGCACESAATSPLSPDACERLDSFVVHARTVVSGVNDLALRSSRRTSECQRYFGVHASELPPAEETFGVVAKFLQDFAKTWAEVGAE